MITTAPEAMQRLFRFSGPQPNLPPQCKVAPTEEVPVVRKAPVDGAQDLARVRWGLMSFWAKDAKIGGMMINARAQGIAGKQACRAALKLRRCLLLADGFNEWQAAVEPQGPVAHHAR